MVVKDSRRNFNTFKCLGSYIGIFSYVFEISITPQTNKWITSGISVSNHWPMGWNWSHYQVFFTFFLIWRSSFWPFHDIYTGLLQNNLVFFFCIWLSHIWPLVKTTGKDNVLIRRSLFFTNLMKKCLKIWYVWNQFIVTNGILLVYTMYINIQCYIS